jgi:hypothetical protein
VILLFEILSEMPRTERNKSTGLKLLAEAAADPAQSKLSFCNKPKPDDDIESKVDARIQVRLNISQCYG